MEYDQDNPRPESDPRPRIQLAPDGEIWAPDQTCPIDFRETHCSSQRVRVHGSGDEHATVALSAYDIVHLIASIHQHPDTGDWHQDLQQKLRDAHLAIGAPELTDNDGNRWEYGHGGYHLVSSNDDRTDGVSER